MTSSKRRQLAIIAAVYLVVLVIVSGFENRTVSVVGWLGFVAGAAVVGILQIRRDRRG